MRFIRKTHYVQDVDLIKHRGQRFWYGLLAIVLVLAPLGLDRFYLGELSLVFIHHPVKAHLEIAAPIQGKYPPQIHHCHTGIELIPVACRKAGTEAVGVLRTELLAVLLDKPIAQPIDPVLSGLYNRLFEFRQVVVDAP